VSEAASASIRAAPSEASRRAVVELTTPQLGESGAAPPVASRCRPLRSTRLAAAHRALTPFSVAVGGCTPLLKIELHQFARVVPAPSPPLLRLEHKPEVATAFKAASASRSPTEAVLGESAPRRRTAFHPSCGLASPLTQCRRVGAHPPPWRGHAPAGWHSTRQS
jgi:hypothetical protein